MKKTQQPAERAPVFNRFQTAISGIRFVKTAVDAHFDPYAETSRKSGRKLDNLESIPRVAIG